MFLSLPDNACSFVRWGIYMLTLINASAAVNNDGRDPIQDAVSMRLTFVESGEWFVVVWIDVHRAGSSSSWPVYCTADEDDNDAGGRP